MTPEESKSQELYDATMNSYIDVYRGLTISLPAESSTIVVLAKTIKDANNAIKLASNLFLICTKTKTYNPITPNKELEQYLKSKEYTEKSQSLSDRVKNQIDKLISIKNTLIDYLKDPKNHTHPDEVVIYYRNKINVYRETTAYSVIKSILE